MRIKVLKKSKFNSIKSKTFKKSLFLKLVSNILEEKKKKKKRKLTRDIIRSFSIEM